jgi:transcriptional regulator GlxA family with amidase domain
LWEKASGSLELASRVPITIQRAISTVDSTDIVIVPSILLQPEGWRKGRYPRLVSWLQAMHERGTVLCSACSGIFLLAETGLFDGKDATVHFMYARAFAATYPAVHIHPERVLMISGPNEELVTSGRIDVMARHGFLSHRALRRVAAAQEVARRFALQFHQDGLTPYIVFEGKTDHGDGDIRARNNGWPIILPSATPSKK